LLHLPASLWHLPTHVGPFVIALASHALKEKATRARGTKALSNSFLIMAALLKRRRRSVRRLAHRLCITRRMATTGILFMFTF
jgi:hypothetical protein